MAVGAGTFILPRNAPNAAGPSANLSMPWADDFARPLSHRMDLAVARPDGPALTERPGAGLGEACPSTGTPVGRASSTRLPVNAPPGTTGPAGLDEAHDSLGPGTGRSASWPIGPLRQTVARRPVPAGPLHLTVTMRTSGLVPASPELTDGGTTGPDAIAFGLGGPDAPDTRPLAELDGRYLSTEVAGGFTGRVIGMYATEGSVAFDWFEYAPAPSV
ncbi:Glycoside hydrolase family 43 protein OS=Streptomyces tendae OX=1932 GN=GUR47_24620 PE=3 SV=1 [Streptomyces tendae]